MRKLSTIWMLAIIITIFLIQPRTFLGLIGYTLTAAVIWAVILYWLFPEPSNMGGMSDSFKRKSWNEYFGREETVGATPSPPPTAATTAASPERPQPAKAIGRFVTAPFDNAQERALARARARKEMGE
jgi:hypothetical protein